jgi:hypothetical protein
MRALVPPIYLFTMSNNHLIYLEVPACERCRADPGNVSARADAADKAGLPVA